MRKPYLSSVLRVLPATLLASAVLGCGSTTLESSWHDPSVGVLSFDKIVAVAITNDASTRLAAEDALVARIGANRAQPSYRVLESEERDGDKVTLRLRDAGFDGAVVMRFVGSEQETNWSPGAWSGPYSSFGGYYGYGWGYYDPGYAYTYTSYRIETLVYALDQNKLVWAGLSSTTDPKNVAVLAREVAETVAEDMRKKGMLSAPQPPG